MQMPKFRIVHMLEATPEEVAAYATMLGLDIEQGDDTNTLMSKLMAANGGSETIMVQIPSEDDFDQTGAPPPFVDGATAPTAPINNGAMAGSLGHEDPQVTILIHNEDRNGTVYDRDVEVGVNGRCWQLRRNVELKIPMRVYLALKEAVTDNVTINPVTFSEDHTPVQRYAHSVIELPTRAEVAAWRERTDHIELV